MGDSSIRYSNKKMADPILRPAMLNLPVKVDITPLPGETPAKAHANVLRMDEDKAGDIARFAESSF